MEEWVDELKRMLIAKRAGGGSKLMKMDQRSRLDLARTSRFSSESRHRSENTRADGRNYVP